MTAIENLPARMAEVIGSHEWDGFPRSAHNQHNYYAACAVCQRDVLRMTEVALGVRDELVAHLSARAAAAEAKVEHAEAGAELSSERLAKVRQELAESERRRSNFEAAWELSKRDYRHLADQFFASCICDPNPETTEGMLEDCPVHGADEHRPLAMGATIERVEALAKRWENALAPDRRYARDLRTALTAPAEGTTTPARETA